MPTMERPGSSTTVTWPSSRRMVTSVSAYSAWVGGASSRYRMPSPPPMSTMAMAMPLSRRCLAREATRATLSRKGVVLVSWEPMCICTPTTSRPGQRSRQVVRAVRVGDGNAELGALEAGGDVGVGLGIDVGVHAEGDGGPHAHGPRHLVEGAQLALGLHVEHENLGLQRLAHLVTGLAHTREDDLAGGTPARSARYSSPPETISAPAPARAKVEITPRLALALTA